MKTTAKPLSANETINIVLRGVCILAVAFLIMLCMNSRLPAQDSDTEPAADSLQTIRTEQSRLASDYKKLEQKLFSLYEFEKSSNPGRSKLLRRALEQSQESMTTGQLELIVRLMDSSKLKDAENEQAEVLVQLAQLLDLLQSDDQAKVRRDEIDRLKEYAKQIDRLLKTQQGIRGQTEGGVQLSRVSGSEDRLSEKTGKLANQLKQDSEAGDESGKESNQESDPESPESKSDDQKSDDADSKSDDPNSDQKEAQNQSEDGSPKESSPADSTNKPSESDSKSGEPNSSSGDGSKQSPPGKPSSGQPSEPTPGQSDSQPSDSPSGDSSDDPTKQVQSKVQSAQKRMDQAKKDLDQAKRDNAIDQMREAEAALELAKQELEEILRQLREEEIEQTLALLEDRFRAMLEKQLKIYEASVELGKVADVNRGSQFEIDAGKLGESQTNIATDAARALLMLEEDGSTIAFPATVEDMQLDMMQVAGRLKQAKVNAMTLSIEEDILDTLNDIIESLVKTQEDMQKMKDSKSEPGQAGQPGENPLVDQLAEIKMLKALQTRIHKRHVRYSKFLENKSDPVGVSDNPDIIQALQRLAERQSDLTEIARELVDKVRQ